MIEPNPHPSGERCGQCLVRTGELCAKCGHDRASHIGRGHYHTPDGPCLECPTSHLVAETCNEFAAGGAGSPG